MQDEAVAGEPAPSELPGPRPEREWEALQQVLGGLGGSLTAYRSCSEVKRVIDQLLCAREALDRLDHALESTHLSCCILAAMPARVELSQALARLASRGVGGLVIVEQQQRLDEYIESGTPLDAQLSSSLLESLFYPGSALHDGAVIVRGTRIMAAGVFLPVIGERRDPGRGRALGGRHRAALAISRLTDALVFVVSEETGEISLALHGQLHPGLHVGGPPPPEAFRAKRWEAALGPLRSTLRAISRWRPRSKPDG